MKNRWILCWLFVITLVVLFSGIADARSLTIRFLDVGQGDSILLQLPSGGAVLVDAGDRDAGSVVVSALQKQKIKSLDMVIASHPHSDHIGGMESVISAFPVKRFLDSGFVHGSRTQINLLKLIERKKIPYKTARAGQNMTLGGVKFQVLAPREPLIRGTDSDVNNNSVVLKVTYGKVSFLLTGDMEKEERERLLSSGTNLASSVLKVAHHGSVNGTEPAFITRVKPEVAVISAAADNDYGHPHWETLQALSKVRVLQTSQKGTITVTTDGKSYRISTVK